MAFPDGIGIGKQITLNGEPAKIVGTVRYEMTSSYESWREWYAKGPTTSFWIEHNPDDDNYIVWNEIDASLPQDPATWGYGSTIQLNPDESFRISEAGKASLQKFDGELDWTPQLSEKMTFADGQGDKFEYSIEFDGKEFDVYKGTKHSTNEIRMALGLPPRKKLGDMNRETRIVIGVLAAIGLFMGSGALIWEYLSKPVYSATIPICRPECKTLWLGPLNLNRVGHLHEVIISEAKGSPMPVSTNTAVAVRLVDEAKEKIPESVQVVRSMNEKQNLYQIITGIFSNNDRVFRLERAGKYYLEIKPPTVPTPIRASVVIREKVVATAPTFLMTFASILLLAFISGVSWLQASAFYVGGFALLMWLGEILDA